MSDKSKCKLKCRSKCKLKCKLKCRSKCRLNNKFYPYYIICFSLKKEDAKFDIVIQSNKSFLMPLNVIWLKVLVQLNIVEQLVVWLFIMKFVEILTAQFVHSLLKLMVLVHLDRDLSSFDVKTINNCINSSEIQNLFGKQLICFELRELL